MNEVFFEITVLLILASVLSIIFKFLKFPSILAYIAAGVIIGPLGIFNIENTEILRSMAEIGVTLLLFILGLELKISDLKSVGKVSLILGVGQVLLTTIVGFLIITFFGVPLISALYLSFALSFSSTIIIVKLLSDKRDLASLYGKISIGVLLIQDLFAIIALILLSGFAKTHGIFSEVELGLVLLKGILLFGITIYLSRVFFPKIIRILAHSQEILFLFSIAWAFGMAAIVSSPYVGFSIEIGGFLAGLALASSIESFHIAGRARSLRDFFIIIFFVTLGMSMVFIATVETIILGLILSVFVLLGKPIIVMLIMGVLGYKKRTSFLTGLTLAQISEFSLILVFLGFKLGHISQEIVSGVTIVSVVTFATSTYMIMNSSAIYKVLRPILTIFERNSRAEANLDLGDIENHTILVGVNRAGESILRALLADPNEMVIIVDFNPDIVKKLELGEGVKAIFGDISDEDILNTLKVERARIIISTASDLEDNLNFIKGIKSAKSRAKVVVLARDQHDADELYNAGVDYVVIPHVTSGKYIAKMLKEEKFESLEEIKNLKQRDRKILY